LLPLSEHTTRQLQMVISEFNRTRDRFFAEEKAANFDYASVRAADVHRGCPFKVVRTNGGDEVLDDRFQETDRIGRHPRFFVRRCAAAPSW
jgi:hypothetical protein